MANCIFGSFPKNIFLKHKECILCFDKYMETYCVGSFLFNFNLAALTTNLATNSSRFSISVSAAHPSRIIQTNVFQDIFSTVALCPQSSIRSVNLLSNNTLKSAKHRFNPLSKNIFKLAKHHEKHILAAQIFL